MLDFSFGELALVVLVALVVVGPKDLPVVLRALGRWFGQFKGIADEFKEGFRSAMHETSLVDMEHDIQSIHDDLHGEVRYIKGEMGTADYAEDIANVRSEHIKIMAKSGK